MKKGIITVFSISVTAGTFYLTYSLVKSNLIKKLIRSWVQEMKKKTKELSEDQIKKLKEELDKLYLWEVRLLSKYSGKVIQHAPENEIVPMITKIKNKKILQRADLQSVDSLLFGT